jgi:hypothetical protein
MRGWAEGGGSAREKCKARGGAKQGEGRTDTRWFQNPRHHNMWCLRHDLGAVTNRTNSYGGTPGVLVLTKPSAGSSGTPQHNRPQHPPPHTHRHRQAHSQTNTRAVGPPLLSTANQDCALIMSAGNAVYDDDSSKATCPFCFVGRCKKHPRLDSGRGGITMSRSKKKEIKAKMVSDFIARHKERAAAASLEHNEADDIKYREELNKEREMATKRKSGKRTREEVDRDMGIRPISDSDDSDDDRASDRGKHKKRGRKEGRGRSRERSRTRKSKSRKSSSRRDKSKRDKRRRRRRSRSRSSSSSRSENSQSQSGSESDGDKAASGKADGGDGRGASSGSGSSERGAANVSEQATSRRDGEGNGDDARGGVDAENGDRARRRRRRRSASRSASRSRSRSRDRDRDRDRGRSKKKSSRKSDKKSRKHRRGEHKSSKSKSSRRDRRSRSA